MEKITVHVLLEMFLEQDEVNFIDSSEDQELRFFEYAQRNFTVQECKDAICQYWSDIAGSTDREGFYE